MAAAPVFGAIAWQQMGRAATTRAVTRLIAIRALRNRAGNLRHLAAITSRNRLLSIRQLDPGLGKAAALPDNDGTAGARNLLQPSSSVEGP